MDIYNFLLSNGPLCILALFGFLCFFKGIPFLIKHNDDRHIKTEKKLTELNSKLQNTFLQSNSFKKDIEELEKDIEIIIGSLKQVEKYQQEQKITISTIENTVLKNWKNNG